MHTETDTKADLDRTAEQGLTLIGIRDLDPNSAEAFRIRTLPTILTLLAASPTSGIRFDYEANPNGQITINITSTDPDQLTANDINTAIARLINPLCQTTPTSTSNHTAQTPSWSLTNQTQPTPAGFSPTTHKKPTTTITDGYPYTGIQELLEALIYSPEFRLAITFHTRTPTKNQPLPDFNVEIKITPKTTTTHPYPQRPPLALAAVVNRLSPGCQLATGDHVLSMTFADAGGLPIIPVGSGQPLPGLDTAPAAPVPIRHRPGLEQPELGIDLGRSYAYSGKPLRSVLTEEEQVRHIHVTGRTGTGKSTFLATMAQSIANRGQGLLVLDPHGTLVDRIAAELPESALPRTLLIRSADLEHPTPMNPLATEDPVKRDLAIADILAGFYAMFDPGHTGIVGPRFEQTVGMCLRTLAAMKGARASILDVPRLLTDTTFQRKARLSVTDPAIQGFWENHQKSSQSNDHADVIAWITSKWERFTTTAALRSILQTGEDALDIETAMEHNHVVLIDLSKGAIGTTAAELLGFLYTTRIWTAALNRTKTSPFTVIVDEAHSLMAGALPAMLSEGRKYGLSIVIAHQFLGQLDPGLSQALAGNTATQVAFRAGRADAETLHHRMGRLQPVESFTSLPDLSALVQRTAGPTTAHPHTLTVSHHQVPRVNVSRRFLQLEESTASLLIAPHPQENREADGEDERLLSMNQMAPQPETKRTSFLDEWLAKQSKGDAQTSRPLEAGPGGESAAGK